MNKKDYVILAGASGISALVGMFGGAALTEYRHDYNPGFSLIPDFVHNALQRDLPDPTLAAEPVICGPDAENGMTEVLDPLTGTLMHAECAPADNS